LLKTKQGVSQKRTMEDARNAYYIFVGKPYENRPQETQARVENNVETIMFNNNISEISALFCL
jgi:hypothetical protein